MHMAFVLMVTFVMILDQLMKRHVVTGEEVWSCLRGLFSALCIYNHWDFVCTQAAA